MIVAPGAMSSPTEPMCLPGLTLPITATRSPSISASSAMSTASAPWGMGAPVVIRSAWPAAMVAIGTTPARTSPTTSSQRGAVGVAPKVEAATSA